MEYTIPALTNLSCCPKKGSFYVLKHESWQRLYFLESLKEILLHKMIPTFQKVCRLCRKVAVPERDIL